MTSVQSAWHIDHLEDLFEVGAERNITVTPAIVALSIVTTHAARGAKGKPQVVLITQTEAAHLIGVSDRSIGPLYQKLQDLDFLARQRSGRFVLGPYWKQFTADQKIRFAGRPEDEAEDSEEEKPAGKEFEPASPRRDALKLPRGSIWTLDGPVFAHAALQDALEEIRPEFRRLDGRRLWTKGAVLSPELGAVLAEFQLTASFAAIG